MAYKRVTEDERTHIYRWRQEGLNQEEIAQRLWRNKGTISREIARNTGQRGYRPKQAHEMAQARAKRPGLRRLTAEVRADVEARLRIGWTPDMISGRARLEQRSGVCKETIYQHIYKDAHVGGDLWTHLPRAKRKRHRRCPRQDDRGRGRIPNQRMIDTRPSEVETRKTIGHWEGDLVCGAPGTGHLITLVERSTRYTLVGRTDSKDAQEVLQALCGLFVSLPAQAWLSATFDNGKEFARHEELSRKTRLDVYFAKPYHAWERGTNENTNGLIRRLYPKKSSFAGIGETEITRIDTYLNDRPRKCLGWMTPREKMTVFLGVAA